MAGMRAEEERRAAGAHRREGPCSMKTTSSYEGWGVLGRYWAGKWHIQTPMFQASQWSCLMQEDVKADEKGRRISAGGIPEAQSGASRDGLCHQHP